MSAINNYAGGSVTPAVWVDATATKFEANIVEALVDAELVDAGTQHDVITFGTPASAALSFTCSITNFEAAYDYSATATNGSVSVSGAGLITVTGLTVEQSSTVTVTVQGAGRPLRTGTVAGTATSASIADNFNRANETNSATTSSGASWIKPNGSINVVSNQGYFPSSGGIGGIQEIGIDTGAVNHFHQIKMISSGVYPAGIAVRCTGGHIVTNSYMILYTTGNVDLYRGTGSTNAQITNVASNIFGGGVGVSGGDTVRLEVEGTTLRAYKNGTLMYTNTGITNNSNTETNYYMSGTTVDDMECGAL